jgi:hypothetical protein
VSVVSNEDAVTGIRGDVTQIDKGDKAEKIAEEIQIVEYIVD